MMNNIEFKSMVKLWKMLKSSIVAIDTNGLMYGTDDSFITLSVLQTGILGISFSGYMTDISNMEKNLNAEDILFKEDGIYENFSGIEFYKVKSFMYNEIINVQSLMCKFSDTITEISNPDNTICSWEDIVNSCPAFIESFKLTSSDGVIDTNIDDYHLTMFSGLIGFNKSDMVNLTIYGTKKNLNCYGDKCSAQIISEFTILKSKFIIKKYIRYLCDIKR